MSAVSLFNFRAVRDRFTHIDATFVSCAISMPGESHYAVRFYPWWEHPAFEPGSTWSTQFPDEAERTVTVYPRGLLEAHLQKDDEVVDWSFVDTPDSRLWAYESGLHVTCQRPMSLETLALLPGSIAKAASYLVDPARITDLVAPLRWDDPRRVEDPGGFKLGRFPVSLSVAVRSALDEAGAQWFEVPEQLVESPLPVLLLIDEEDYLVATDFEVDVPEFDHEEGWVRVT
ncbi:MAG: hypothetical protein QOE13_1281 [Gaiellaceae bacterium]|nr:hypothetical protein [Gaiellaceae bacterium]